MPTSEWKAATSSGIEVIGTRRAITAPIAAPIAMPTITSRLPRRDVAGLDNPRSDRMNSTPATRYNNAERLALISGPHLSVQPEVAAYFAFFLYIASMRWVTRKPPKMFTQAKTSAMKPKLRAQPEPLETFATPPASSAPTTMTDEIALVTDISGVCSAGVTDHTTK